MKVLVNDIKLQYDENREAEIVLKAKGNIQIQELKDIIAKGKQLVVELKQYRQRRSLDANGYLWLILGEMASILHTTKDELYLKMLEDYGVYTFIVVKENVVERVKSEWKTVKEIGEVIINGQTGIQLMCFFGSSTYNTKEFSTLLDGVIQEAKELGIETMTPSELSLIKSQWGGK